MAEISLNASMRSNLLSLQQTQRLQDTTQMRLSSGLKVNSAIDNPSSYYTASSLNNRAEDLGALLDAMTQGIQTIKAANEVLETGTAILQQANAVVSKAMEFAPTELSKDWFIKEAAKQNGVVVSNAVELQQAIDDNKELIVVYGKINLTDTSLNLKNSQKLVGTEYFSNIDKNALYRGENNSRKSELVFNNSGEEQHAIIPENNTLLSDLSIKYTNMNENGAHSVIYLDGNNAAASKKATINNLDIELKVSETAVSTHPAIHILNNGEAVINGRINIQTAGKRGHGIYAQNKSTATILSEASVNIKTSGAYSYGTHSYGNSVIDINSGAQLNILTTGSNGYAIYAADRSNINIASFAKVNVKTTGTSGYGILTLPSIPNNKITIQSSAEIFIETAGTPNAIYNGLGNNTIILEKGVKLGIKYQNNSSWRKAETEFKDVNTSSSTHNFFDWNTVMPGLSATQSWTIPDFDKIFNAPPTQQKDWSSQEYISQYQSIINQYDQLINDASYKGVNLLEKNNLKINFNEERSSGLEVKGVDASSAGIGLNFRDWKTSLDVQTSLDELSSAVNKLRDFSSQFGNYYSIVNTREDFTQNLINVLTEGADKLTLADMNQESANMLALQTRQQLAINSLSLASQAAQSVLKLF